MTSGKKPETLMFWLVSTSHMLRDKIKWDVDEPSALKKEGNSDPCYNTDEP